MERLSSRSTSFYKKAFPVLWCGLIGLLLVVTAVLTHMKGTRGLSFLAGPAVVVLAGYYLIRTLVRNLADEVWDDGTCLLVRNAGEEDRIDYRNIEDVSHSTRTSPTRVTVRLRTTSRFGSQFTFLCPTSIVPMGPNKVIMGLVDRIGKAKDG